MKKLLASLLLTLVTAGAAVAAPITMLDGVQVSPGKVGLRSDKIELRSSGSTGQATLKYADSVSTTPTITIPSSSGNDTVLLRADTATLTNKTLTSPSIGTSMVLTQTSGNYTFTWANPAAARAISIEDPLGTDVFVWKAATQTLTNKTLTNPTINAATLSGNLAGSPVFTTPLVKANVNTSVKRQSQSWQVNGAAGSVLADGTTYKGFLAPGRAVTITKVNCLCGTKPIGGTSTIKVLKASASGNTTLSAATVDPTTFTDNTISSLTLTATGADLALTAAQGVYVEWVTGTQTTDGVNCTIAVEYELDDI